MLKVEVCAFSGLKIYPGHGKRVTRADGRTMIFLSSKCERNNALKRNPRKINWTVLYRRKHRKGMVEEATKKRRRRRRRRRPLAKRLNQKPPRPPRRKRPKSRPPAESVNVRLSYFSLFLKSCQC